MIIQGKRVLIAGILMPAQIKTEEGKISAVLPYNHEKPDEDFDNAVVAPGFIDVHTHGAFGFDVDSGEAAGLVNWLQKLPGEGVTSFLPTTTSQPDNIMEQSLANVADIKEKELQGAQILGVHTEGPMLDSTYRGAHDTQKLQPPSIETFEKYQEAAHGNIRYTTIAVEHDADFALTRHASRRGVVVSIGHSGASMETALLATAAGASSFTHSFNGMTGLHHRTPGVVGALMVCNAFAEIIGDGLHVLPGVVNILFKARNNKMILVSDSLLVKGLAPGRYVQGGQSVDVDKNGAAYLMGSTTLAGSSLYINRGVELLVKQAGVSLENALLSASFYPAQVLGITDSKGQLRAGNDADIVVLEEDFSVRQTYCRGKAML